jgi:hypothetical protein
MTMALVVLSYKLVQPAKQERRILGLVGLDRITMDREFRLHGISINEYTFI